MCDMSKQGERLTFITVAQVFSMLLIVLSHSVPIGASGWMAAIVPYLQLCGLPVFMTLSGFLVSYTNQLEKYGYRKFVVRRSIRLLVPYFAISILMLLPKFIIGSMTGTPVSLKIIDVLYQLIAPREGILPHLWFIVTLWILCLMVPLFRIAIRNRLSMVAVLGVTLAMLFIPKATDVLALGDVQIYAFWFLLGLILGEKHENLSECNVAIYTMPIIAGGYLLVRILWEQNKLTWFLYSLFCLIVVLLLSKVMEIPLKRSCTYLGRYSFTIYILSLPVQNIADIVMNRLGVSEYISYVSLFILGLIVPIGIGVVVEMVDRKIGKKIFGNLIGL